MSFLYYEILFLYFSLFSKGVTSQSFNLFNELNDTANIATGTPIPDWKNVGNPTLIPTMWNCLSFKMLGGYLQFDDSTIVERTITSLPSHYRFEMDLKFYTIDDFNGKNLEIYFDNQIAANYVFPMSNGLDTSFIPPPNSIPVMMDSQPYSLQFHLPAFFDFTNPYKYGFFRFYTAATCGGPDREYGYIFKVIAPHNSSTITIRFEIKRNGNTNIGYWGFSSLFYNFWSDSIATDCAPGCMVCNFGQCHYCNYTFYIVQDNVCLRKNSQKCQSNSYLDSTRTVCYPCHVSCLTCNGGSSQNCTNCSLPYWLAQGECVLSCPSQHFFEDLTTRKCIACDLSCLTCDGNTTINCLTCDPTMWFIGGACVTSCPIQYYEDLLTRNCIPCDASCLTCDGPLNINCLSCSSPLSLSNNECNTSNSSNTSTSSNTSCFSNQYEVNNTCIPCDPSCKTCNGPSSANCLDCNDGNYLIQNNCLACKSPCFTCEGSENYCLRCEGQYKFENGSCILSCPEKQYWDNYYSKCFDCDPSCLNCLGPSAENCTVCYSGFYLENSFCHPAQNISFTIEPIENPFSFSLKFSNFNGSTEFFQKIPEIITVEISNFKKNFFNYSIIPNPSTNSYSLIFNFSGHIPLNHCVLTIQVNSSYDKKINLKNDGILSIPLNSYQPCVSSSIYYIVNGECFPKEFYVYTWTYTNEFNVFTIHFKNLNNSDLIDEIVLEAVENGVFYVETKILSIKKYLNYWFEVSERVINLHVDFKGYIYGGIEIELKFNETKFLELNSSEKIQILTTSLPIEILDFSISTKSGQQELIEITSQLCITGEILVIFLLILTNIFDSKSGLAIRGLLFIKFFQIIKYLKINYPQNARIVFTNGISRLFFSEPLFESKVIDELLYGLPQLYSYYNVSLHLVNNLLDEYIIVFTSFSLAILLTILNKIIKKGVFKRLLSIISNIFIWNFCLMITFSKYINTVFFVIVSLKYAWGYNIWNSFITIVVLVYIIVLPIYLVIYIKIINKLTADNKISSPSLKICPSKIVPSEELTENPNSSISKQKKSVFFTNPNQSPCESEAKFLHSPQKFEKIKRKIVPWTDFREYHTPGLKPDLTENNEIDSFDSSSKKIDTTPSSQKCIKTSMNSQLKTTTNSLNIRIFPETPKTKTSLNRIVLISMMCFDKAFRVTDEVGFLKKYAILHGDLRETMGLHKYYYVFYLLRYFFVPGVVVLFFDYGLLQMTIISLINIFFFVFLIAEIPFKTRSTSFVSLFNELCINVCYISSLCIAYKDIDENRNVDSRINLGWSIDFSYIALMSSLLIATIYRMILLVRKSFKKICQMIS